MGNGLFSQFFMAVHLLMEDSTVVTIHATLDETSRYYLKMIKDPTNISSSGRNTNTHLSAYARDSLSFLPCFHYCFCDPFIRVDVWVKI